MIIANWYLYVGLIVSVLCILGGIFYYIYNIKEDEEKEQDQEKTPNRGRRLQRMRNLHSPTHNINTSQISISPNDEDDSKSEDENQGTNEPTVPLTKLDAKKMRKQQLKDQKKAQNEETKRKREEYEKRREEYDRLQKEKEEMREKAERDEEERIAKAIEERKRKEEEEYEKMEATFCVLEEGIGMDPENAEKKNSLKEFISYIQNEKIVHFDGLASKFSMKTIDVISRVKELLHQKRLEGVIDDKGRFIFIPNEKLTEIAFLIKMRGRVSLDELTVLISPILGIKD